MPLWFSAVWKITSLRNNSQRQREKWNGHEESWEFSHCLQWKMYSDDSWTAGKTFRIRDFLANMAGPFMTFFPVTKSAFGREQIWFAAMQGGSLLIFVSQLFTFNVPLHSTFHGNYHPTVFHSVTLRPVLTGVQLTLFSSAIHSPALCFRNYKSPLFHYVPVFIWKIPNPLRARVIVAICHSSPLFFTGFLVPPVSAIGGGCIYKHIYNRSLHERRTRTNSTFSGPLH